MTATCRACGRTAGLAELLLVVPRDGAPRFYVCRPSRSVQRGMPVTCFRRRTRSVDDDAIKVAA